MPHNDVASAIHFSSEKQKKKLSEQQRYTIINSKNTNTHKHTRNCFSTHSAFASRSSAASLLLPLLLYKRVKFIMAKKWRISVAKQVSPLCLLIIEIFDCVGVIIPPFPSPSSYSTAAHTVTDLRNGCLILISGSIAHNYSQQQQKGVAVGKYFDG